MSSEWDDSTKALSVDELKTLVKEMRGLYDTYKEAKEVATAAYDDYQRKEAQVITALEDSGLRNFNVPGLGTASLKRTAKVSCPKSLESKRELFDYIKVRYGGDFLDTFRTINYQALNKFYKEEKEVAIQEGIKEEDFKVPGLEETEERISISFRKESV